MILHLITRLVHGGAQLNTILTAEHQARQGHRVVLASGPETGAEGSLWDMARAAPVETVVLKHLIRNPHPLHDVLALRGISALIRRLQPQVVHTHTSKAGLLGRWAAHVLKVPVIVHTPHGHVFHSYFSRTKTALFVNVERALARLSHRMVALTETERDEHLALGVGTKEQFVVIPSGVDITQYAVGHAPEQRASLGWPTDAFTIGCVARLVPIKGVLDLVYAVQRLQALDVHLVIAGDGPQRREIEETVERLGLATRVTLLGTYTDIPRVLGLLDVLVVPSHNEGMGRVAVEGMAAGLPIVATAVGGLQDLVQDGETGLLVKPHDPAALALALTTLARDPERTRTMGQRASRTADRFSLQTMLAQLDQLYAELGVVRALQPAIV